MKVLVETTKKIFNKHRFCKYCCTDYPKTRKYFDALYEQLPMTKIHDIIPLL